jgi:hypothetical protein
MILFVGWIKYDACCSSVACSTVFCVVVYIQDRGRVVLSVIGNLRAFTVLFVACLRP